MFPHSQSMDSFLQIRTQMFKTGWEQQVAERNSILVYATTPLSYGEDFVVLWLCYGTLTPSAWWEEHELTSIKLKLKPEVVLLCLSYRHLHSCRYRLVPCTVETSGWTPCRGVSPSLLSSQNNRKSRESSVMWVWIESAISNCPCWVLAAPCTCRPTYPTFLAISRHPMGRAS